MAIIIDTYMPETCGECKLLECGYGHCKLGKRIGLLNEKAKDCPIKSADDMIAEIENLKDNPHCCQHYERGIKDCLEVIHKYTKEAADE